MHKRLARLSKPDLLNVAEIAHRTASAGSREAATGVFQSLCGLLPVRGVVCVRARWDADGGIRDIRQLLNFGYPPEWLDLYRERRYDRVDPVLRAYRSGEYVQIWSQAFRGARSAAEYSFIEACTAFGLCEGLTVGQIGADGCGSVVSFWGHGLGQVARHRTVIECLAPGLHDLLLRLSEPGAGAHDGGKGLTAREQEMLYWASLGKTTWEIGRITGIRERTVMFHMGNAMHKLEARNRAQAIAKAALLGLLAHPP
ncbi:LuxR family transcriptional regulator [Acidiferrobacter sp.]|uniref:helix-turn-helix transcriptional regulator n=1 Tax=Acidiferrobacter sp. TaxID=1872107 RepID=UPI0026299DE7|nr:LuxR family transcriptional regulator [Acidiferrobacter sp.]